MDDVFVKIFFVSIDIALVAAGFWLGCKWKDRKKRGEDDDKQKGE